MDRLQAQWQRLFLATDTAPAGVRAPRLVDAAGRTRVLMIELARPADWPSLATVWQGVQQDLGLPAPAIAVSGREGFQLWFGLSEPLPAEQGLGFLRALRERYLSEAAASRLRLQAGLLCEGEPAELPPQKQDGAEQWSAFISPDLAPVFADCPWLDMAPGADGQADLLAGLQCLESSALAEALTRLEPQQPQPDLQPPEAAEPRVQPAPEGQDRDSLAIRLEARAFLRGVMNDAETPLPLRIEAARALLTS